MLSDFCLPNIFKSSTVSGDYISVIYSVYITTFFFTYNFVFLRGGSGAIWGV